MTGKTIAVLGSSRSEGNTYQALQVICGGRVVPVVDLKQHNISPYDYAQLNQGDDFIPLMERIVEFETIALATPVYWYTMSATMKIFIDRLSDLLEMRKDLGRQLRGKRVYVIASFNTSLPKGFELAFEQTCAYLGMIYLGCSFVYSGDSVSAFLSANPTEVARAQSMLFDMV